jgi:hypothetical protein
MLSFSIWELIANIFHSSFLMSPLPLPKGGVFRAYFHAGFRPLDGAPKGEFFLKVGTADRIV